MDTDAVVIRHTIPGLDSGGKPSCHLWGRSPCRHSSARYDRKDSRVSRSAFPRPAASARRLRLHRPDRLILKVGVTTQRDSCVSTTPDVALNPPPARNSRLKSAARPAWRHPQVDIGRIYATLDRRFTSVEIPIRPRAGYRTSLHGSSILSLPIDSHQYENAHGLIANNAKISWNLS